ncbi:MAG TPA: archease [Smithella sp.]|nr:archease [Smithella sp.]
MPYYNYFDHTADIGIEISGRTKKELFANAACALFDVLIENIKNNGRSIHERKGRHKTIIVEGADAADLLINFLREMLYLFNGEHWVVDDCEMMELGKNKLVAKLTGESYNKRKHLIKTEIKAVTYGGLSVIKANSIWKARIIFDV